MKGRKGFTLIELLAVIVILAVIALIATPLILNVIETAKKGAAEQSANGYIKAVEDHIAIKMLEDSTYTVPESFTDTTVAVKGDKPTAVSLTIKDGVVTSGTITVSGYTVEVANGVAKKGATKVASKSDEESTDSSTSGD